MKATTLVMVAALVTAYHRSQETVIDGRVMQGYEAAVAFVRRDAAMRKVPFVLANYDVIFEKGYRYHFQVKEGPNYKPWPGLNTDLGFTVRVYVDEKTLKVIKGVVE